MVHEESLALAEEWLESLAYGSVKNDGNPLVPRTIRRYRDEVVGREVRRLVNPHVALLDWWGEQAPGEPIWSASRDALLEWWHRDVRDAATGGTKEPSSSQVNNRRSAALNFMCWCFMDKDLPVSKQVVTYKPPVEDRASTRRKQVRLNPLLDGVATALWVTTEDDWENQLWMWMAACMTMRIDEMADLRPGPPPLPGQEGVDLERRFATFMSKGRKLRTVHYGELMDEWSYLPHVSRMAEEGMKRFEDHVYKRQEDAAAMPPTKATDPPWWVWPHTEGEWQPGRDNKRVRVWTPSANDLNRFDKRWQKMLTGAGFQRRQYTPHQLRHFSSTNMWRAGTPWLRIVTEMGHDEGATTLAYSDFSTAFNKERARNERKRGLTE